LSGGLGIANNLDAFPQTRQFAERVIIIPLVIFFTWFLTGLVNRLTDLGVICLKPLKLVPDWQSVAGELE
jgi:hypothetical protein